MRKTVAVEARMSEHNPMSESPSTSDVEAVFKDLFRQFCRKNSDYGNSVFEPPEAAPGVGVEDGIAVRLSDKVRRIASLRRTGSTAKVFEESLDDTIGDLAVYAIIWLAWRRHERKYDISAMHERASKSVEVATLFIEEQAKTPDVDAMIACERAGAEDDYPAVGDDPRGELGEEGSGIR